MQTPFETRLPTKPLKYIAPLVGEKAEEVPAYGRYIGLEQIEPWAGALSGIELAQKPEGAANTFQPGDILFGKLRPYLAKAWVADSAGYCTTEGLVLRSSCSDPRYVRYCLLTTEAISAIDGSTFGSKMPRADWEFIGALQLPCPSREAQEKIANFLDDKTGRIDALIAEKERLLSALSEFRKAVIQAIVTGTLSEPGVHTGSRYFPQMAPGWRLTKIKYIAISLDGKRVPLNSEERSERQGEYPYYGASGPIDSIDAFIFDEPLVLVGEDGANLLNRNTPLAFVARGKYWVNNHAHILRPNDGRVRLWSRVIESLDITDWVSGSAQPKLTIEALMNLPVPNIPEGLRQQLEMKIEYEEARIEALEIHTHEHIARLREYRSSLISAAVTGQIDVRAYEVAA